MASLLNCELLEVGGRSYRVLAATGARGQAPAAQQHHYEAEEDEREEWGRGQTGTGGGGGFDGGAEEEASSVPIHQDGDGFVARMRLDAEVRAVPRCSLTALSSSSAHRAALHCTWRLPLRSCVWRRAAVSERGRPLDSPCIPPHRRS